MEKSKIKCLLVANKETAFGTLTDGDIRRALLSGANLNSKIEHYVEQNLRFKKNLLIKNLSNVFSKGILVVPVVDKNKNIFSLLTKEDINKLLKDKKELNDVSLVIMAGGRGTRMKILIIFLKHYCH